MQLLVPLDSPLRNPPENLDPAQKAAWDALRFALDLTHLSYQRLVENLIGLGRARLAQRPVGALPTLAFLDAWSVVDNLWRLHCVLRNFPGLKQHPQLEAHLRAFKHLEELRNGVQHLVGEFRKKAFVEKPIMGSLCWAWMPEESPVPYAMAITAGALRDGWIPLLNGGLKLDPPIALVTIAAFGTEVDLTALMPRVEQIAARLDRGAREAVGEAQGIGADVVIMMPFTITASPPTPTIAAEP